MIAIASDHGGYELKQEIMNHLFALGVEYKDYGAYDTNSCDYPDYAQKVCEAVNKKDARLGILLCGTGVGISIAANKINGIRAALCSDYFSAKYTRKHNDSNIICFGGRTIGAGLACELVDVFLNTEFDGGRHQVRVDKIMALEGK